MVTAWAYDLRHDDRGFPYMYWAKYIVDTKIFVDSALIFEATNRSLHFEDWV